MSRSRRLARHAPLALAIAAAASAGADPTADARAVAALDTAYQAAVERNDADAMARILHPDFVLVVGSGATFTRAQLLASARDRAVVYEKQVEDAGTQTVRMFGADTAVVTALLWIKGTRDGGKTAIDKRLWFSDTYVRTPDGWKYAFGQASTALPATQPWSARAQ